MQRVDVEPNIEYVDKVRQWRVSEVCRFFPAMPLDRVRSLADNGDPYMLEKAKRLHDDGCPHELAYRIMR